MKYFLSSRRRCGVLLFGLTLVAACTVSALGELPSWIRNVEASSALEGVFFRMMPLPGGPVMFRRPPRETLPTLSDLIKTQPQDADLYSLRALEDEQQLDPATAEGDWKAYVEKSSEKANAQIALADFYHRRMRSADEIKTLSLVASSPPLAGEKLTPPAQQPSWQAFERIFSVIQSQGLPKEISIAQYRAWIARYPQEPSLYARFLQYLVAHREYSTAGQIITEYRKQFPNDQVFPVKAKAMVEYRQGSVRDGLGVYEHSFQPLWDPELVKSYFDLLRETQSLRKFLDQARAALNTNPEDLNAMARVFYYYQQQGKLEVAQQAIADFRMHKESSKSPWTSQELYACARLLEDIHAYPESARYYFALFNSPGMAEAPEQALSGLTRLLLTAPETPIRFGSGELSMYRDIATMDQGPGYLNGILSLILNTTQPASQYSEEELRAVPYFHRSRAVELLALLDAKFPNSPHRPELHAQVLEYYAAVGQSDAVIQGGREFLPDFPAATQRTSVALLMADAYALKQDSASEFAIYDSVLKELGAKAQSVPLGATSEGLGAAYGNINGNVAAEGESEGEEGESQPIEQNRARADGANAAFQVGTTPTPARQAGARSLEYARVLERYLARLVQLKRIPQGLSVLRGEIDRNPDDPGLYERLAVFLDQNRLGSEQEEVYRRAMARFPDRLWYDKLARFYLRYKRNSDFEQLTQDAVKTFNGSNLEQYFRNVNAGSPGLYLRLNQYANQRFPHNPVFVHNLLYAYQRPETRNQAAWEALLRQHWFEEADLRSQFFEYLSRSNKLDAELSQLRQSSPDAKSWESNPAGATFLAYAAMWRSHFEESAPVLKTLASQYPAEVEIGRAASSVYRSLAYFDPSATDAAARIEDSLLQAHPRDTAILARIGDIYADREHFSRAAPYWDRIPQVDPGLSNGYLEAATIYWDYYDFDNALRLLNQGRTRLGDPNLYAYEAGAIYENQRDYPRAIEEYGKGALTGPDSSAELRLLTLARRAKFRALIDKTTANIAPLPNPVMPAVNLRVKVLEAQNRKTEMEAFLDAVVTGTNSIEEAESIEALAQQKSLESVREHAIQRQAALTTDPVNRLQLRYALIRSYEARKDFQSAEGNVAVLYRENPKILGVVRSTVDFYWRVKNYPRAISVLLEAAKASYPELAGQFTYEAARKSTETKQYPQARDLLTQLLKDSPYNGKYLAAAADNYAQAGDDQGLQQFYTDKITSFRNAPLPLDTRKTQIATLRRGLILALTRMKDYPGAVDQYIELINSFPEDDALVTEAALYALRYQRQVQLAGFYTKTVAQSPRDSRWSMVLAHIQTSLEDYPAAIDTYGKAVAIRPDRADLYITRAGLEERLMRFDDAAADYARTYQLAYRDPQWMEKVAEVRARQGKTSDAVASLKTALIDGRPESAAKYFEVARRLETWGMLDEARGFAEQGIKTAGSDLLADADHLSGAKTYVRIMTRLRQHEAAYAVIEKAFSDASLTLPVMKEQVVKQGIAGLADQQWRNRLRQSRVETARNGFAAALQEMGAIVNAYFTPEERLAFSHIVEAKRQGMDAVDLDQFAIPFAQSAGLADQEARWRFDLMMHYAGTPNFYGHMQPLIELQRRRGRYSELAGQLEQNARLVPANWRKQALLPAADAYRSAGDPANELRVLSAISADALDRAHQQHLFQLLLDHNPQELLGVASAWNNSSGEPAADFAVAHADATLAHSVVEGRGKQRTPVWTKSYNALVGLYFAENSPVVNSAFLGVLGDDTIAQRLAKPVDRSQQLAGSVLFYYGSRYGEYLGDIKQGAPEEYLPAVLEESPASAAGYLTLADYYAASGDTERALADYTHTLELSPNRPDVYDSLALVYYKRGDRTAALAQWKQAFATLSAQLDSAHTPESFWADFGRTCDQLRTRHLFSDLKPDVENIVRTYLRHNGNYRSNAVLQPAYAAVGDPATGTAWLLDLSSSAHDPGSILGDVVNARWIPLEQRAPIYQRILALKQDWVNKLSGLERESAQQDLNTWQVSWIRYLAQTKRYTQAGEVIASLPKDTLDSQSAALVPLDLQVAAKLGTLDAKLAGFRTDPQSAPALQLLRTAARQIFDAGDKAFARKILEFVFAHELDEHQLVASNFLGLAEIRLASGDTPGALDLLRRLVVVVGNPFENLDPAAALLEKSGHNAEAVEFLEQLVKSTPWNPGFRLRLAKARLVAGQNTAEEQHTLATLASGTAVPYALRLPSALALAGRQHSDLGSGELNLLAGDPPSTAGADKFYFYEARIRAAQSVPDARTKVDLLSHCVIDFPGRDEARIPLFKAAVSLHSDERALGALESSLLAKFQGRFSPEVNEEDEILSSEPAGDYSGDETTEPAAAVSEVSRAQRAEVARMIGEAMLRLNRVGDAVPYFEAARQAETSAGARKELDRKIAEAKGVLQLQRQNAGRQPLLHEALEQDRVVRPRLLARAAPTPKSPTAKGGRKQ